MLRSLLRKALIAAGVVGGSGVAFLLIVDNLIMPSIDDVPRVTVPDVRNRTIPETERLVRQMGLRLTLRDSVFSDAPWATCWSRNPAAANTSREHDASSSM